MTKTKSLLKSFFEPDCPHKDKCCDKPNKCDVCNHNKRKKKSYFQPIPYKPWTTPPNTFPPYTTTPDTPQPTVTFNNQPCLIDQFFKNNPNTKVAMISCPCPKCSPQC